MTQVSIDSADPPGSVGQADLPRTHGPLEAPGLTAPGGPIERFMSTLIRKLAWSRLSDPRVAVGLSGAGLLLAYRLSHGRGHGRPYTFPGIGST